MGERAERDATDVWEDPDPEDPEKDNPRDPRIAALIEDKAGLPEEGDALDQLVDDLTDDDDDGDDGDGD